MARRESETEDGGSDKRDEGEITGVGSRVRRSE